MSSAFFSDKDISADGAQSIIDDALHGADDGELFLESTRSEVIILDDGRIKQASFDEEQGLRPAGCRR